MKLEPGPEGSVVELRPQGAGRFIGAAFLGVWLCGWAVGECAALGILGAGLYGLVTHGSLPASNMSAGGAVAVGAFILVWLTIWTFGGYTAGRGFLRLLWSRDRVIVRGGTLVIEHQVGPFRRSLEIGAPDIRRIAALPHAYVLTAETATGSEQITCLGTPADRRELADALRDALSLGDSGTGPIELPAGWQSMVDPEGHEIVLPDVRLRAKRVRFMVVLALLVSAGAAFFVNGAVKNRALLTPAVVACVFGLGAAYGAWHLARGRKEWRIGGHRVTLRSRFGDRVRDVFEADALELTMTTDSNRHDWWTLSAVKPGAPPPDVRGRRPGRRSIASAIGYDTVPRRLGEYLAARARIPLDDQTTPERRAADLDKACEALAASGPLGASLANWMKKRDGRR